jgi:hypothetical protein
MTNGVWAMLARFFATRAAERSGQNPAAKRISPMLLSPEEVAKEALALPS